MIFDIFTASPNGLNVAKMERALKASFSLVQRPRILVIGQMDLATGVYTSGTGTIFTDRNETAQMGWNASQQIQALAVLATSTPANGAGRIKIEDLEQLGETAEKGQVVFVADLPRETSGTGSLAYWSGSNWRKVSTDGVIS